MKEKSERNTYYLIKFLVFTKYQKIIAVLIGKKILVASLQKLKYIIYCQNSIVTHVIPLLHL